MSMTSPPTNVGQPPGRSVLIPGTRIKGDIDAPGVLEIQGHVVGHVGAETVVVAEAGHVEGEIKAQAVTILGRVDGSVDTAALRLHGSAQVEGTMIYDTIAIDSGASITAQVRPRQRRADPAPSPAPAHPAPKAPAEPAT